MAELKEELGEMDERLDKLLKEKSSLETQNDEVTKYAAELV